MAQTFDVIIIGAGPNGLAIGAYLSKAGEKVLLLFTATHLIPLGQRVP